MHGHRVEFVLCAQNAVFGVFQIRHCFDANRPVAMVIFFIVYRCYFTEAKTLTFDQDMSRILWAMFYGIYDIYLLFLSVTSIKTEI